MTNNDAEKQQEMYKWFEDLHKSDALGKEYLFGGQHIQTQKKHSDEDPYARRRRLLLYYRMLNDRPDKTEETEKNLTLVAEMLRPYYQHLEDVIKEDLVELKICYAYGAYKSAIILAGSILEAFLLDWLSSIDGVDYFEKKYYVWEINKKGKRVRVEKNTLFDYINQIEDIHHPDWMESGEKAHFIRKSRNIVHAKVCLKEECEINGETCDKVISYLNEIVTTRLEKEKAELHLENKE